MVIDVSLALNVQIGYSYDSNLNNRMCARALDESGVMASLHIAFFVCVEVNLFE